MIGTVYSRHVGSELTTTSRSGDSRLIWFSDRSERAKAELLCIECVSDGGPGEGGRCSVEATVGEYRCEGEEGVRGDPAEREGGDEARDGVADRPEIHPSERAQPSNSAQGELKNHWRPPMSGWKCYFSSPSSFRYSRPTPRASAMTQNVRVSDL